MSKPIIARSFENEQGQWVTERYDGLPFDWERQVDIYDLPKGLMDEFRTWSKKMKGRGANIPPYAVIPEKGPRNFTKYYITTSPSQAGQMRKVIERFMRPIDPKLKLVPKVRGSR